MSGFCWGQDFLFFIWIKCLRPYRSAATQFHEHLLPHMHLSHIIQSVPPEIQSRANASVLRFILQPPATLSLLHQPPASVWRNNSPSAHSNISLPIDYGASRGEIDFFKHRQRWSMWIFEGHLQCCCVEEMNWRNNFEGCVTHSVALNVLCGVLTVLKRNTGWITNFCLRQTPKLIRISWKFLPLNKYKSLGFYEMFMKNDLSFAFTEMKMRTSWCQVKKFVQTVIASYQRQSGEWRCHCVCNY